MNVVLHFLLLPLFLIFSAFFSSSESAIFSLTEYEKKKIKSRNIHIWHKLKNLLDSPTNTISLIITGNIIANTIATSIIGVLLYHFSPDMNMFISILLVTSVILLSGEIFPKLFALRYADKFSLLSLHFLPPVSRVVRPLTDVLTMIAEKITAFADIDVKTFETKSPLSEIYALVKAGEEKGILEKRERVLAEKVLDFSKRLVKEIMTPRVDIIACNYKEDLTEVKKTVKVTKHTKYPVYKENLDNIVGVLYTRELIFKSYARWQDLIQPLLVIPEYMRVDELLLQFRERNEEIALIVDEYGGTSGIVTLEDILEELVGEIEDEYQKQDNKIEKVGENTYILAGDVSLVDVGDVLGVDLKMEGVNTLAGLLLNLFQKLPSSGQSIEYKGLKFFIDEVSKNKIKKVTVRKTS